MSRNPAAWSASEVKGRLPTARRAGTDAATEDAAVTEHQEPIRRAVLRFGSTVAVMVRLPDVFATYWK